jgi:hypothetical protein
MRKEWIKGVGKTYSGDCYVLDENHFEGLECLQSILSRKSFMVLVVSLEMRGSCNDDGGNYLFLRILGTLYIPCANPKNGLVFALLVIKSRRRILYMKAKESLVNFYLR